MDKIEEKRKSLFSWDDVPRDDNEKLRRYLRDDFTIEWAENATIRKSPDGMTINISTGENSAEICRDKGRKAILRISDGRTSNLRVKKENGKLNIYISGNDPGYTIGKVEDIIGIRLVCIHPSDVEALKEYILKNEKLAVPSNGIDLHDDDPSGYRALHMIVTLKDPIEWSYIKCEIQIITMLQEAWGFKTHGPIYEERKYLEEEYKVHAKFLSECLNIVDLQTEFLLKGIQRRKQIEDRRRSAFIKEHLSWLLPKAVELNSEILAYSKSHGIDFESIDDPDVAMQLMIDFVKAEIADKSKDQDISAQLDLVMKEVREYENKYGIFDNESKFHLCEYILHIVELIEAFDVTGKFSNESLNHVDRILRFCAKGSENEVNAHLHKALIFYCFSNFEKAREEADKALYIANRLDNPKLINGAKNSYGYFTAEWVDNNRKEIGAERAEMLKNKLILCLNGAIENETNSKEKNQYRDTLAFVFIVLGSNISEIEEGIRICNEIEEDELHKIYYQKHMWRAHERILEIYESQEK